MYSKQRNLFNKVINASELKHFYGLFEVNASEYWNKHYTFGKSSKKSVKRLTKKFVDLLVINALLPLKFCYAKHLGKEVNEELFGIISQIRSEKNSIISNFRSLGVEVKTAADSQAILQLHNEYCTNNRCLQCAVGSNLLHRNG